jgi:hypothetical protein
VGLGAYDVMFECRRPGPKRIDSFVSACPAARFWITVAGRSKYEPHAGEFVAWNRPAVQSRTPATNSFNTCPIPPQFYVSSSEMWKLTKTRVSAGPSRAPATLRTPWHAVSILCGVACCPSAMELLDTRFLSQEAPRLPLKGCLMASAGRCSYQHHDDRRVSPRRAPDLWNPGHARYAREERRGKRGRRSADLK